MLSYSIVCFDRIYTATHDQDKKVGPSCILIVMRVSSRGVNESLSIGKVRHNSRIESASGVC